MENQQKNLFSPYELQFTIEERKAIVAEMIRELRKSKGYQQKELANILGISPQTYNAYERGRNEPPIELLVRLSFLYQISVDAIVARNIFHRTKESAKVSVEKFEAQISDIKEQLKDSPYAENEQINELITVMSKMNDMMRSFVEKAERNKK